MSRFAHQKQAGVDVSDFSGLVRVCTRRLWLRTLCIANLAVPFELVPSLALFKGKKKKIRRSAVPSLSDQARGPPCEQLLDFAPPCWLVWVQNFSFALHITTWKKRTTSSETPLTRPTFTWPSAIGE